MPDLPYGLHVTIGRPECDICLPRACPNEPVLVTVSGTLPDGCVHFRGLHELPVAAAFTVLEAVFVVDSCEKVCTLSPEPFHGSIALPPTLPGTHSFQLRVVVRACPDTTVASRVFSQMLAYDVLPECPGRPPLDSLVRSFTSLRIVPEHPCAGDSLTLQLVKNGCPPCVHLEGLALTRVRGFVASLGWRPLCNEFRCQPETLSLPLGQFAAGFFQLNVNTDVHVLDTPVPDSTIQYKTTLAFEVARTCDSTVTGCLHALLPPFGTPIPECSLRLAPGIRGDVFLPVQSDLRKPGIAGVQGWVVTYPPFHVVDIHYAGAAPGVQVSWGQDGQRSRFILFGSTPDVVPDGTSNLLRVTVEANAGVPVGTPLTTTLNGAIELASGPDGEQIPICAEVMEMRSLPPAFRLCIEVAGENCDANGDGHADVRDLVLMTRCFRNVLSEPDSVRICRDCDGDGVFGFADLFCCAREILRGPLVPRDSVHASDQLSVTMDAPAPFGTGMLLRVHVRGADALGAALLRLRYPADRWRADIPVTIDQQPGTSAGWLPVVDTGEPGLVHLGGLRLQDQVSSDLEFLVAFTPTATSQPGDRVETEGADLAAPDGTVLTPVATLPSAELGAQTTQPATVELAPASPNPFSHSTTFAISLPSEAEVDLAVHDLAGRRIATLAHGRLGAGRRIYTWNGGGVRDGVYFVRLSVDGRMLSTRVALLRNGR